MTDQLATPHDRYVAKGYCSFIYNKTWCNGKVNHSGQHWALYHHRGFKVTRVVLPSDR